MRSEFFVPRLANRDKRGSMSPDDGALARARKFVDRIRRGDPESSLPADVRKRILQEFPQIR
jgi:hypothetical protein